ncbi:chemotaxis protein CheX [Saccharibacillus endophyticus]|uniref:Chemotaxis protein CheX n=1 Tax=Saccharibacillus endophyticus TaxID=2060666 RepID=A0ABQ2A901_9BACL|nr:chemotaxis protein CheX [Saccharibacillus endophyticus]GGH86789.1 chemotaxis protein CheX [Saccharibacillus endophyticus]
MDVTHVNPFIESFMKVMPQLGFAEVRKGGLGIKGQDLTCSGIIILVGIVGALKGNVVYRIDTEHAKKIASTMMMGMPVEQLDDMARSALSELSNMLTATAATEFAGLGISIDISTPTLLSGDNISVKMSSKQVLSVELLANDTSVEVLISFEN